MAALMGAPMLAFGVVIGPLPDSGFADTEASTNVAFVVDRGQMLRGVFELSLVATPSNNVEVSVGCDANGDGRLAVDEADCVFGYDCGQWFSRDMRTECATTWTVDAFGRLTRRFELRRQQLDNAWNLVRVTRRGMDPADELVFAKGEAGTVIFVR